MQHIEFDAIPLFQGLDRISMAKLIPCFREEKFRAGEMIFSQGAAGDSLYIIIDGLARVFLSSEQGAVHEITSLGQGECFGEVALLTGESRSAGVQALTHLRVLRLMKNHFDSLIEKHHSIAIHFARMQAARIRVTNVATGQGSGLVDLGSAYECSDLLETAVSHVPHQVVPHFAGRMLKDRRVLSLLLTTVICLAGWGFMQARGLSFEHSILLELLLGASVIWSFDAFSYHSVAVSLPLLAVLFKVATPGQAFSGFSSPSWFLVLGVFAISAAISKTGLMYRLVLLVVRRFPPTFAAQSFGLALAGLLLTPIIPSSTGRTVLASPMLLNLSETLGLKKGSNGAVGLSLACLLGFGHMSFLFMNGTATCFLALGLLPKDSAAAVTWGTWFRDALPLGIAFFAISYLAIILLYRPRFQGEVLKPIIDAQLKTLGPLTKYEKFSMATVAFSLLGFMTESWHHINGAWVAMVSFLILSAGAILDEKAVRRDIDWNFLISFGALVGFGNLISSSGLGGVVAATLRPYLANLAIHPLIFLPATSLAVHLIRLVLPLPAAQLVAMLALMPVVKLLGFSPFVVMLVVLVSMNPWFFPHQNYVYLSLVEATEGKLFTHRQTLMMAACHIAVVLAAIALSVPIWRYLGLL